MENKKKFTRYTAAAMLVVILFVLIIFRLAQIQIVKGEEYRRLAVDKSLRKIEDDAPRGKILDRNGIELAANTQQYTVFMMKPGSEKGWDDLVPEIERIVEVLASNNQGVNDDFGIILSDLQNEKYEFKFNFSEDEDINRARELKWKKDNGIPEGYNAEQAFNYLKEKYDLYPEKEEHDNIPFIRKMMVIRQMVKDRGYTAYKPIEIAYVNRDTAFELMEKSIYLPGVDVRMEPLRTYPFGELASVVLGSLRKIPGEKASEYSDKGYDVNADLVGRSGIEEFAEEFLRGEKGGRLIRVDAYGRIVEEVEKEAPVVGNNVVLTIDKNLQEVAERSLDEVMKKIRSGDGFKKYPNATRGAAVVIDVKTGEILAMASRPGGFDPNIMSATGTFDEEVRKILYPRREEHPGVLTERIPKPMFNYATAGAVPPGSTFKMITGIAGLETGKITPSEIIIDRGRYEVVNGFNGACWLWNMYRRTHGPVNLARAIQISCNYYFFEVGRRIGLDKISEYAKMFGLDREPSGIEIYESPGDVADRKDIKKTAEFFITSAVMEDITRPGYDSSYGTFEPTEEQKELIADMIKNNERDALKLKDADIGSYKIRRRILDGVIQAFYEYNKPGIPLNASIGQGENRFTPLQIASYMAALANDGTRYRPHLVNRIVAPDGTVVEDVKPEVISKTDIEPSTFAAIKAGMDKVVDEGGTAEGAFKGFPIKTAGKTGTAQASGGMDDYSWFSGFAPAQNPKIAVAIVIHEGGGVGTADVARAIYEEYFALNDLNVSQD